MGLCNPTTKTKEKRMNAMSDIYDYWITKKNIIDRFGGRNGYDATSSVENMKWLIEQRLEMPWDSDSPLTDAHYRRIKVMHIYPYMVVRKIWLLKNLGN